MTFFGWLKRHGYRQSTALKSVHEVELARRLLVEKKPVPERLNPALGRYLSYRNDEPERDDRAFLAQVASLDVHAVEPRTGAPKRRRRPHTSFDLEDWQKLTGALSTDLTPCGICLWVLCVTGIRVGDLLRTSRGDVGKGLKSGVMQLEAKGGAFIDLPIEGTKEAWDRLWKGMTSHKAWGMVSDWIVTGSEPDAGGAAYQRVNRYLRKLGAELKLKGPVHLHRLRRTVAFQALDLAGGDIRRVQQLLGQATSASTERYVDEIRFRQLGVLQERLGDLRGGAKAKVST